MSTPKRLHERGARRRRASQWMRKYRAIVLIAVGLAVFGLTQSALFQRFVPFQTLEQAAIDFRFHWRLQWRGHAEPFSNVAVVAIEDSSLNPQNVGEEDRAGSEALELMRNPYPWNRKLYALLIERLFSAGAKVVALDLLFLDPKEGDEELAAVLRKYADRVVIASRFALTENSGQVLQTPAPTLLPAGETNIVGYATFWPEIDSVIRRVSYRTSQLREAGVMGEPDDLTALSALAVEKFTGQPARASQNQLLNFRGPARMFPNLPIEEVFIDRIFKHSRQFEFGKVFENKIVFVGPAAELFHDVHTTPFEAMPGVNIHAQAASSLLQAALLQDAPAGTGVALTFLIAALVVTVCFFIRHAVWETLCLATLGAGFLLLAQWLFTGPRVVIPMVPPLFAFLGTGTFSVLFDFLLEQWERARIRGVLDRYVSKNVAELVLADAGSFEEALRGQRKGVTTLFSDIRSFTAMTEEADPDKIVAQLNEYFYKMVDAVLVEDGTLQKFIGDAIMAVWGDTHSAGHPLDAAKAVRTALLMRTGLADLNAAWAKEPGRLPFTIGIGVSHGEVIVGNIGHPRRMEFTVLGDAINTTARLESATKQYHCDILLGDKVEELTRGSFVYRRVDRVKLKGKTRPLDIFTVLGGSSFTPPSWLAEYHRAIELFRGADFATAGEIFEKVLRESGGQDFLSAMYAARCETFARTPPGSGWDGSHALTEK